LETSVAFFSPCKQACAPTRRRPSETGKRLVQVKSQNLFPFDLAKQNELYIKFILSFVAKTPWLLMMQRVTHLVNKFGGQGLVGPLCET
jgi:hypothetical protein